MIIKNVTDISWTEFMLHFVNKDVDILQAPIHQRWQISPLK